MADTWTYSGDPSASAKDAVRFLIADTDVDNQLLRDAEITWALAEHDQNVRRAAADCLDVVATDQAMVAKVMKVLDITTDGAKLAEALRKQATALRAQADATEQADDAGFEVAEMVVDSFTFRERLDKEALRDLA